MRFPVRRASANSPGAVEMLHDPHRGVTEVACLHCGRHWNVYHELLNEQAKDGEHTRCWDCSTRDEPLARMDVSQLAGTA